MLDSPLRKSLERLYRRYNRPEFVYPDPLAALLRYRDPLDQEIAGLIASALAFGNVKQILRSVDEVLEPFPHPHEDLLRATPGSLERRLGGFRHRYVQGREMIALLLGMRRMIQVHGSLGNRFALLSLPGHTSLLPALIPFTRELREGGGLAENYLLPDPRRGSACKRLFLFLRWMVRRDAVDPGPWNDLGPGRLIVPMDTHMHRVALRLGFTRRRQAGLRAALEVTEAFRALVPQDPVRYDFALTRLGIRAELDPETFFVEAGFPGPESRS